MTECRLILLRCGSRGRTDKSSTAIPIPLVSNFIDAKNASIVICQCNPLQYRYGPLIMSSVHRSFWLYGQLSSSPNQYQVSATWLCYTPLIWSVCFHVKFLVYTIVDNITGPHALHSTEISVIMRPREMFNAYMGRQMLCSKVARSRIHPQDEFTQPWY